MAGAQPRAARAAAPRPAAAAAALVLVLLLAAAPRAAAGPRDPKGARISLRAKWPGTPLLHEAAEFLAEEDPELFWRWAEEWAPGGASAKAAAGATAPDQCWAHIAGAGGAHLSRPMSQLFAASLAARQYSPRLEMFRQLALASRAQLAAAGSPAAAACCWALLRGAAYTEPAPLEAALAAALTAGGQQADGAGGSAGAVYPFDHLYAPPDSAAPPLIATAPSTLPVELYAPLGSACGARLHAVLAAAVARSDAAAAAAAAAGTAAPPRLAYAWRPLLDAAACGSAGSGVHACVALGSEGPLVLPGYGVEMALKNMEYKAEDEGKKDGKAAAEQEEAGDEEAAVQGGDEGEGEAAAAPSGDGPVQLTMKHLGLQAAQRILNAANSSSGTDPLAAMQELAQDFPRLAAGLSHQKFGSSLRRAVEGLQRMLPAGSQFLLLNGLVHPTRDLSLFDLLDSLRREVRLYDSLAAAGLPPAQLREAMLVRGSAAGDGEPPRLRLASDRGIAWLNDLEKDSRYAAWPRQLQSLLMPMYPGRLPTIGRNVLTAIYLFDPASPSALDIGSLAHQLLEQSWPVRLGLVPVVPARALAARGAAAGAGAGAAPSPSERMGRLLAAVHAEHGGAAAAQLLSELRSVLPAAEDEGADFAERLWEAASQVAVARWADWDESGEDEEGGQEAVAAAASPDGKGVGRPALAFLDAAAELAQSSGLAASARAGVLVLNGIVTANEGGGWQGATMQVVQGQLQQVQEDVYMGRLADASRDVYEDILRLHGSIPRYNPRLMPLDGGGPGYVRISGETEEYASRQLSLSGPLLGPAATAALPLRYLGPQPSLVDDGSSDQAPTAAVTHWVVADVSARQGLSLVAAALQHRSGSGRVGLLLNSAAAAAGQELTPIEQLLAGVASGQLEADPTDLADQLDGVLRHAAEPGALTLQQLDELTQADGQLESKLGGPGAALGAAAAAHTRFARRALGLGAGASAVVTNGRVVELPLAGGAVADGTAGAPAAQQHTLEPHDFELLELFAQRNQFSAQAQGLARAAAQAGALGAGADVSALSAALSSALAAAKPEEADPRSGRLVALMEQQRGQRNHLVLPRPSRAGKEGEGGSGSGGEGTDAAEGEAPPLVIHAILNPVSKASQRLAPLLAWLRQLLDAEATLLLNPKREYDDMPLKTFYRYALPAIPGAGAAAGKPASWPPPPAAEFSGLPPDRVLTLGMDEPEPWLVEPVEAQDDLDNLRLESLGEGQAMQATYELEALMLTGMVLDLTALQARLNTQVHPRGVQLELAAAGAAATAPPLVDTLVMSNLGYFQLKAAPGLWTLRLAPGRSRDLFTIASSTGASSSGLRAQAAVPGADAHQVPVALSAFSGKHMHLFLRKDPARMAEDVLEAGNATGGGKGSGLWNKVASLVGGADGGGAAVPAPVGEGEGERETLHVFTVASGHMYERLQKIMILSAIKRTPARIKFWFIKNYMSPEMKAFVPHMAAKYGFDFEFVTYKWPSWLHKQSEKQRIIWAYKILFLDVLFPLGLKKVIFCDSDQVVRADLRELWHLDLQGAPYGYTPMGDNNKDMEGFRFWKQGFWRDHLQGKPYHISALYVVDLERFRQLAAGDRLRVMYDGLSKDPNSLANLDQDLPNYAQSTVPIFSLPQEWLWCETWCGNETRLQAKTIDLCNNPLTKEPKLQSARRIIAEWPHLNREAEEFTDRVGRVQRGEWSEAQLLADTSAFHVRLAPMVEGSVWTSDQGDAAPAAGAPPEGSDGSSGGGAAHDPSEL